MICPECKAPCNRDEIDIGFSLICTPWECSICGWYEFRDGYPMLEADWQNKFTEEDLGCRTLLHETTRVISANDLHVITTQFLDAAKSIHIAMCRFDDDHAAQAYLSSAMQSILVGAEQCRQLHGSEKIRRGGLHLGEEE